MICNIPSNVLQHVFSYIDNPKDLTSIYSSCKDMQNFMHNDLHEVTINMEYERSVIFLRKMKSLRVANIFRTYDNHLDLQCLVNVQLIFVNSDVNIHHTITQVPSILHSYDELQDHTRLCYSDNDASDWEDEFQGFANAIEYFTHRYRKKKHIRVPFRGTSFKFESKHFFHSI
jgi:hypothetical protein